MRFRITAKYTGYTSIKNPFKVNYNPYTIGFNKNEDGYVSEIFVEIEIEGHESELPKIIQHSDRPPEIKVPNVPYAQDLIEVLQCYESFGGFWFGAEKIHWEDPEFKWIPENEEDKKKLGLYSIAKNVDTSRPTMELDTRIAIDIIANREKYKHMIIPLSFLREGLVEHRIQRYINAFYNLYFFMEDLYGRGKTKNKSVEEQFRKSKHVNSAVLDMIETLKDNNYIRHKRRLKYYLKLENLSMTVNDLIKLIVSMRGNLHHFSQKSTKIKGHPFNQRDYETLSYMMLMICCNLYMLIVRDDEPK